MVIRSFYGLNEFIICCGYKGYVIKEYFANYFLHNSDVTFNLKSNEMKIHNNSSEPWSVTLVNTGEKTMTGERLKRVSDFIKKDKAFCFTYGDGVSDINIKSLVDFHLTHGKQATITATYPPGRFGALDIKCDQVVSFTEKPQGDGNLINAGFFVLSPNVLDSIEGDDSIWESTPIEQLTAQEQVMAFKHQGFWQPMDTLRDKLYLEDLWSKGEAPWKVWD